MHWSDISFSRTTLRQFAGLWIVFFTALGLWCGLRHGQQELGIALVVLAVTIGPLGVWRPEFIKPIYTGWMAAVFPIGWLMSNVLLGVVYLVVVTPIALVFRLMKRDVLQRRSQPQQDTYWRAKPMPDTMGRYLRQY
jgi:hypothetical protein